jgi:hypothetical protein
MTENCLNLFYIYLKIKYFSLFINDLSLRENYSNKLEVKNYFVLINNDVYFINPLTFHLTFILILLGHLVIICIALFSPGNYLAIRNFRFSNNLIQELLICF